MLASNWWRCLVRAGVASAVAGCLSCLSPLKPATADGRYGSFGPEGPRMREQLWIVPGADPLVPLRTTVFKPHDDASDVPVRHPLAIINHGSDEGREATSMPVFYWLSRWFIERGYVVVLPQRRGHGATGGEAKESQDSCADPDHYASGSEAANDIEGVLRFMRHQDFIEPARVVVVGVSTGGWGALALAARNPEGVRLIVNFAGGRGAYAYGRAGAICAPDRLVKATAAFAQAARVPSLWYYAVNDSYFGPEIAASMAAAWNNAGGRASLKLLQPYGAEGHRIADDRGGWKLWGETLDQSLRRYMSPNSIAAAPSPTP
jgi:pimeloyl-ACP methyl ester carboxylesterase